MTQALTIIALLAVAAGLGYATWKYGKAGLAVASVAVALLVSVAWGRKPKRPEAGPTALPTREGLELQDKAKADIARVDKAVTMDDLWAEVDRQTNRLPPE